jgi:DNA-binding response OmpR family regulator
VPLALIVEDEALLASLIGLYLRKLGYDAATAVTVKDASRLLREGLDRYDLAYFDALLPDGLGRELIDWARQGRPGLPCILASGDERQLGAEPRPFVPLTKPFTYERFVDAVRRATA